MATQEGNLFDRIGGELGLERLLADFYDRVLADAELARRSAVASLERGESTCADLFCRPWESRPAPRFASPRPSRPTRRRDRAW